MCVALDEVGLDVERSHHEVGAPGQAEINYKFATLTQAADDLLKFKYVIKNTADQWGKTVTFMPKPVFGDNGSGMHCHQSLWQNGEPLFYDERGYAGLSDVARWYIGGLIEHSSAVLAFTNPTVNSYKRLVPGYEAPVNMVYSQGNRPQASASPSPAPTPRPSASNSVHRTPPPTPTWLSQLSSWRVWTVSATASNPCPIDKDLYELPAEEAADIKKAPANLEEALAALEADHDFLLAGDVFTEDLISAWIDYKRSNELAPLLLVPHPSNTRCTTASKPR